MEVNPLEYRQSVFRSNVFPGRWGIPGHLGIQHPVYNNRMSKKPSATQMAAPPWYRGADVPMRVIRRFALRVAGRFRPEKIILFGSYAYGTPHADSDVDILVVMVTRNQLDQAARIELACDPPFPLDIIVRTPKNMKWRLEEGDSFLQEIALKGKILHEKADGGMGEKGRGRSLGRRETRPGK